MSGKNIRLFLSMATLFASLMSAKVFAENLDQKLKPISQSLSVLSALIEQLNPDMGKTKWENLKTPGLAAKNKQVLDEMDCRYTLPEPGSSTSPIPTFHIEISGPNCPILLTADVMGEQKKGQLKGDVVVNYEVLNPKAMPDEDVTKLRYIAKIDGPFEGGQKAGYLKVDLNVKIDLQGQSRSQGSFTSDSSQRMKIDVSPATGFSMETTEDFLFTVADESGRYRHTSIMGIFSAEEHFYIDKVEVKKARYQEALNEWKFPFINLGLEESPEGLAQCKAELFDANTTTEEALKAYIASDVPPVAPTASFSSCSVTMERDQTVGAANFQAYFNFHNNYVELSSVYKGAQSKFSAEPLYILYDERQGRVERASPEYFIVQICAAVTACQGGQ